MPSSELPSWMNISFEVHISKTRISNLLFWPCYLISIFCWKCHIPYIASHPEKCHAQNRLLVYWFHLIQFNCPVDSMLWLYEKTSHVCCIHKASCIIHRIGREACWSGCSLLALYCLPCSRKSECISGYCTYLWVILLSYVLLCVVCIWNQLPSLF